MDMSGGDPLNEANIDDVLELIKDIRIKYPNKTIWLYTGFSWEQIVSNVKLYNIAKLCDVVVDGRFVQELADVNYPWAGSTNQRVIDINKTMANQKLTLLNNSQALQ